jgi:hypothetical protein
LRVGVPENDPQKVPRAIVTKAKLMRCVTRPDG